MLFEFNELIELSVVRGLTGVKGLAFQGIGCLTRDNVKSGQLRAGEQLRDDDHHEAVLSIKSI